MSTSPVYHSVVTYRFDFSAFRSRSNPYQLEARSQAFKNSIDETLRNSNTPLPFLREWSSNSLKITWMWDNSIANLNSMLYYFLELFPEQLSGDRVLEYEYEGSDYLMYNVGKFEKYREFRATDEENEY